MLSDLVNYDELKKFVEENYESDEDPSAPWCCAQYIRYLMGDTKIDVELESTYPFRLYDANEIKMMRGIHHFCQESNEEVYYFTLEICEIDEVYNSLCNEAELLISDLECATSLCTITHSFVGANRIITEKFYTEDWVRWYNKVLRGDTHYYEMCFLTKSKGLTGIEVYHD
ncbi:MAG TPA: hypothetical protein VLE02_01320 [Nitrosarchaeum sp.]|nr:hypothetical protein [Nitrosarchaeum sp.]